MPVQPKIKKKLFDTDIEPTKVKQCSRCGRPLDQSHYAHTYSFFYADHLLPVCNECICNFLKENEYNWETVDKVCQWADIPFIVKEWDRLVELNGEYDAWPVYAKVFAEDCYQSLGWSDYFKQYVRLREAGMIEEEIPKLDDERIATLHRAWGANYSEEELTYLEDLFKGMLTTQNINGPMQQDQARKVCKLSLEIDSKIRAGDKEVDKFLSSYDKLVKTAEFTPKNTKNAADFDSFAEVGLWLEKRGRQNKFYDGTTRDIIDETLKSMQNYNQRLYINEGGIGEAITERLKRLENVDKEEEGLFGLNQQEYDLDEFDNAGFAMEDEEFDPTEEVPIDV